MRQLYPTFLDPVDPEGVLADLPSAPGRPAVRVNMVATADGATAIGGVSAPVSGPPDKAVYRLLRSFADVVLVAAGTVRAEGYRPARIEDRYAPGRVRRGQTPVPAIAVVSRRLDLDWRSALFTEAAERTVVITTSDAEPAALARAREAAEVVTAGAADVDLAAALTALGARGAGHVLCEGGPTLNGALAGAGLIDELCLTISPRLAAGDAKRIVAGPDLTGYELELRSVLEEDGYLFLRYRGNRAPAA